MKEKIERLIKLIPLIYPIIIFLGFYNYVAYYRFFDIEIFNYLSIYELLFSFISLVIPIIIVLFLGIFYLFFMLLIGNDALDKKSDKHSNSINDDEKNIHLSEADKRLNRIKALKKTNLSLINNKSHLNLARHWALITKKIRQKRYLRAASHFFLSFSFLIGFLIKIILWLFFITFTFTACQIIFEPLNYSLENYKPYFSSEKSTLWYTIIWSCILYAIIYKAGKSLKRLVINIMQIIPIVFVVFLSITIFQKMNVERTMNHQTSDVSFLYNNETIESNSKKIYIGKTSNYLFLRDVKDGTNYIYSIDDISNLEIRKLKSVE